MLVLTPNFVLVSFHNIVLENLLYTYLTKIVVLRYRKEKRDMIFGLIR